jgi:molybdopterin-guanine dinucleotide biosynthesis protein A
MTGIQSIASEDITGLVLCGGRGTRMGGVDKGLQTHQGMPLALHALMRLQGQVGQMMVNANRNLAAYESMGVPVWPDALPDFPGPLAGWLSGLEHCETPYMMALPCDTPALPLDLVTRLAQALAAEGAEIAMVTTLENGVRQKQPVFCLMKSALLESLAAFLHSGERKITAWTSQHHCVFVHFDEAGAFFNVNTLADLRGISEG